MRSRTRRSWRLRPPRYIDAGADLVLVQDLLGHKNVANTRIYARLTSARGDALHRAAIDSRKIVRV